jgi:hypothetical protein
VLLKPELRHVRRSTVTPGTPSSFVSLSVIVASPPHKLTTPLPQSFPSMNRMEETLDSPVLHQKMRAVRMLCIGLIASCLVVMIGVIGTVAFALGNQALPKNGALLGGVPILTVIAGFITLNAVVVGSFIEVFLRKQGLRAVATTPPAAPEIGAEAESKAERILNVYAKIKFVQFALAEAACVVTSVMYHLSADWLMMAFAAGMPIFMLVKFPTTAATLQWYNSAVQTLEDIERS